MRLERNTKLITRRLLHYLVPSILMIFAMQFASLIDGILVGNMIGNDALTATSLVMPILYIVQLPGFALGVGGSIVIANLLGKRDLIGAKRAFSISIIIGVGASIVFMILGFIVSRPLANLFNMTPQIREYAYQYIFIFMVTDPIISFALLIGNFMAVDNNPKLSGAFFIVANVVKIGSEFLFIHLWGLYGAAISTPFGYGVALVCIIFYIKSKRRLLSFTFIVKNAHLWEVLKASSTTILNLTLTAIQMFVANIIVGQVLTSEVDIFTFGLVMNMVFLFDIVSGGIINVIPNICGILYGEKDIYSLKAVTRKIYIINIVSTLIIASFVAIFPYVYCAMFGYTVNDGTGYIATVLRVYLISFFGYEISKANMNYYPSIDKISPSIVTVLLREAIIVLPLTIILLYQMGLMGYVIACAVTESATLILTYVYVFIYSRIKKQYHGIFLLEKLDYVSYDISIDNQLNNASLVSENLTNFALEHHIQEREAQIVGLASEEIVNNIVTYGYKHVSHRYIDINLKIMEGKMVLRIRDDGLPFDPTKYEYDDDKEYSLSGIRLIEKLTDKMSYMRLLNLNNTVFEINI